MHPRLIEIGPVTIYSFGLMMGIGFVVASYLLTRELNRKRINSKVGSTVTLLAIVFGIIGSKILYLIESWPEFIESPFKMAFSASGLTWYGGFLLATFVIWRYTKLKKISFLKVCDAAAPALALGYGIARIGCHLSGDGDYGMPTTLPWAAIYSNGTYPPSLAFKDFPDIVEKYGVNGIVPNDIPVHPAPLYETISGVLIFAVLWKLRTTVTPDGKLFMLYLILASIARFLVEFVRLNPRILFNLTEAQLIAVVLSIVGLIGYKVLSKRRKQINTSSNTSKH